MAHSPEYGRRSVLRMMLGLGAAAVAGTVVLTDQAAAAPLPAPEALPLPESPPLSELQPEPAQDLAADPEKPETLETQYYYRRRYYRRRAYRRRVYRRRVYRRRYYRYY